MLEGEIWRLEPWMFVWATEGKERRQSTQTHCLPAWNYNVQSDRYAMKRSETTQWDKNHPIINARNFLEKVKSIGEEDQVMISFGVIAIFTSFYLDLAKNVTRELL